MSDGNLLLLGFGNVARHLAAFYKDAAGSGRHIYATTRSAARLTELQNLGIEPVSLDGASSFDKLEPLFEDAFVLVSFPPDGTTDATLSRMTGSASKVVYISSTGVYGRHEGIINQRTPVDENAEEAGGRLVAEEHWLRNGNTVVLRAPALYSADYGLHKRLAAGQYRLPGDGERYTSRIHMEDLARIIDAVFHSDIESGAYPVGDLCPCTQKEIVTWLCRKFDLPFPDSIPLEAAHHTQKGNRRVDPSHLLRRLNIRLLYPSYRDFFDQKPTPS